MESLSNLESAISETKNQAMMALSVANEVSANCNKQGTDIEKLKLENENLKSELQSCQDKISGLDNYMRRSNLIFDGIVESNDESSKILLNKIHDTFASMKVPNFKSIKLERFHSLGFNQGKVARPIIVRFCYYMDRELIWSLRTNLKGSNIFIREDFCRDTLAYRSTLIPIMKAAKASGSKCTLVGDNLILDGKRYPRGQLGNLPDKFSPKNLASKNDEKSLAFYGKNHPLSNFYMANFTVGGITFNTVEQFYQYNKAVVFKDAKKADEILKAANPSTQKHISKSINDFCEETWESEAKNVMHNGVLAKFTQNADLLKFLKETGAKNLYEASPRDLYWGVGLALSNPNILDHTKHRGLNYLGEILMSVRCQLCVNVAEQ
jgi:hypothetical protein